MQGKSSAALQEPAVTFKVRSIKFKELLTDGERRDARVLFEEVVKVIRVFKPQAIGYFSNGEVCMF